MIDPDDFATRQMELAAEWARYVLDHPEVDRSLPPDAYIYFHVEGDVEFNNYSQQLAARREREEGAAVVCVKLKGLAPPQGSRLIDPEVVPGSHVA